MTYEKLIDFAMEMGPKVLAAVLIYFIGSMIIKTILKVIDKAFDRRSLDPSLHTFLRSLTKFGLKVVLFMTVAGALGVPMTSFITLLGAVSVTVGLSLKDSLSSFAGGVIVLISRPFNVGDFIETQSYKGTVTSIQMFYTTLLTPDNLKVLIPNGEISNAKIVNYTAEPTRRVDLVFCAGYDDDISKVKRVIQGVVDAHPLILKTPEPLIKVANHGESSVDYDVKVWVNNEDYWTVHYDLLEQVKVAFDKAEISIPYPQRDVHMIQQ